MQQAVQLPEPDSVAQQHSEQLVHYIKQQIDSAQGKISFQEFMQSALYAPGLGYYSAGLHKFGKQGDFVTAPEISPLFAQVLAMQYPILLEQMHKTNAEVSILEFGAGSGKMAADIMAYLEQQDCLPYRYYIMEISADLRQRQQSYIAQTIPQLKDYFLWLDELPSQPINALVLANEVLDAMPVRRIKVTQQACYEQFVAYDNERFDFVDVPSQEPLLLDFQNKVLNAMNEQNLVAQYTLMDKTHSYCTEINSFARSWIESLSEHLAQGAIILIDYGYPQAEYLHPQRNQGTLMCHYRHHRHDDPFYLPGLQDITSHVNFSDIKNSAQQAGLSVDGYTTQAHFLLSGGLAELVQTVDIEDTIAFSRMSQQIKMLTLPNEMGELFKVMLLGKNICAKSPAFEQFDLRHKL